MGHLYHCKLVIIIIIAIYVLSKINSTLFKEYSMTTPIIEPLSNKTKHFDATDLYRSWNDVQTAQYNNTQSKNGQLVQCLHEGFAASLVTFGHIKRHHRLKHSLPSNANLLSLFLAPLLTAFHDNDELIVA